MKKRLVSALLALSMLCSALPAPAFAQGADSAGLEQEQCSCSIRCTADGMNPDCPVCAADPSACGAGLDPATVETADPEPTPEPTATPVPTETPAQETLGAVPSLLAANDGVSTLAQEGTKPVGEGTQEEPYQISTADDLFWFAGLVNGTLEGVAKNTAACAVLTTNITISEGRAWTPIGNSIDNQYTGTFDGAGFTIDNLKIEPTENDQGFVGYLGSGGAIQNLTMGESCSVSSDDGISVGGVCGSNESGTIENCTNRGTVSGFGTVGGVCGLNGGTLTGCTNSGKVTGSGENVGGVCGINQSTLTGCTNSGEVTGSDQYVGGVCGENMGGTIQNCANKAEVTGSSKVGGVCGENYGPITGCTNSGAVSGGKNVGGLCGYNSSNITYCYSTGTVTSNGNNVGGVCGFNGSAGALTNCYWLDTAYSDKGVGTNNNGTVNNVDSKTDTAFSSGAVCWLLNRESADSPVWYQNLVTDTYPVLDSSHGTVYCIDEGLSFYSNNSNAKLDISDAIVTLSQSSFTYSGTEQKPTVTVTLGDKTLTENTHYTVAYSGNCIDAGGYTVTVTGTGVCSGTVSEKHTIYPAEISIASATVQGKTYDGNTTATVDTVTFDGLVNGESLTSGTDYTVTAVLADKNVGDSKSATVTVELKNGNYTFVQGGNTTTATARIAPLPVELNWETTSFTYDGSEHSVTATITNAVDGDNVSVVYDSNGTKTNKATAAGAYTATVSGLSGNDAANYTLTGVSNTTQTWSITTADSQLGLTVDKSDNTYTYGEIITFTVKPEVRAANGISLLAENTVTFTVGDVELGSVTATEGQEVKFTYNTTVQKLAPGTHTVTATYTGGGNLNGTSETVTVTLAAKTLTAAINGNTTKSYDGTTEATGLSITLNGVVSDDAVTAEAASYAYDNANAGENKTITASGITLSGEDAGFYTVNAAATTTGTITPATLTVTADNQTKTYGDADPELTYTATGLVGEDKLNGELARNAGEDVGDYAITQGTLSAGSNYTIQFTDANLSIAPLAASLTWDYTAPFTYGGTEKSVTATVANKVGDDTFTLTYEDNTGTAVGNYTAKVTGLGNDNYTLTDASGMEQAWSIVEASIAGATVELNQNSFTYNGSEQKPTVIVTLNGKALDAGTDYDVDFGGDSTNVGTVTVTVTGKGNYSGEATNKPTYTISPATPILAWSEESKTLPYTGSQAAVTAPTVTLVNSESYTGTISYQYKAAGAEDFTDGLPTNAGSYTVVASIEAQGNYTAATSGELALTIEKAAATGTASAVENLTYNGQAQNLVAAGTATGGTLQYSTEQNGAYSTDIPTGTEAKTYTVWYKVVGDANHNDTAPASVEVTIAQRPVELTWSDTSFTYNGNEQCPTAAVNNKANSTDEVNVTVTGGQANASDTAYTATAESLTGAAAGNYTLTGGSNTQQTFTIAKAEPTVTDVAVSSPATIYDTTEFASITLSHAGTDTPGTVALDEGQTLTVGAKEYNWTFTPDDANNYTTATGSITLAVVEDTVESIAVTTPPTKTTYTYGESLDLSGMVVTATCASSKTKDVTDGVTVSPETLDTSVTELTITYGSLTTTQLITVNPKVVSNAIIELNGTNFEFTGSEIEPTVVSVKDGDTVIPADEYTISYSNNVNVDTSATVTITDKVGGNYTVNGSATFEITKAAATVTVAPTANTLTYNGQPQALVTAGTADGGEMQYSTQENGTYNSAIPTGTNAGEYTVWYKVVGDTNHSDTEPVKVEVTIAQADLATATVDLGSNSFTYTGTAVEPTATITLGGTPLTENTDYTVTFDGDTTNVGTVTVTVTGTGNYTGTATSTYAITPAELTITGAKLAAKTYDGTTAATVESVAFDGVQGSDALTLNTDYTATAVYADAGAGDNKTATVTVTLQNGNYTFADGSEITYPLTGQTIAKAAAAVAKDPAAVADLTYNGQAQALVTKGTATGGTMVYSLEQNGEYAESIPTGTNAGDYTVWYKVAGDANHNDTAPASEQVTIAKKAATVTVQLDPANRITAGDDLPTVGLTYSGLVEGESIAPASITVDGMPSDSTAAGNYTVTLSAESRDAIQSLEAAKNYNITFTGVTLTILEQEVVILPAPEVPGADEDEAYRLEQSELTEVPEELEQAGFETVGAIQDAMYAEAVKALPGVTAENTELHDVTLLFSEDGGMTWVKATKDNFPASGITVTLPYPEGTNAADYDFVVTHMATVAMNDLAVGEVETPAVTKTADGLRFTVKSLSPVAVSWKLAPKTESSTGSGESTSPAATPAPTATPAPDGTVYYTCPACGHHDWIATDEGYRCDTCGYVESLKQLAGYGNVKGVYEPKTTGSAAAGTATATVPQTGDESNPVLWLGLLLLSSLALGGITLYRRKKTQ